MDSEGDASGDSGESDSESSILGNLSDALGSGLSGIGSWLQEGFGNVTSGITQGLENLVSNVKEMLKELFVPTGEVFTELTDLIYSKFPIVEDIKKIFEEFKIKEESTVTLKFTLYGQTVELANFEWLGDSWYAGIKVFLVGYIYIKYLIKLYKKLPQLIKGGA